MLGFFINESIQEIAEVLWSSRSPRQHSLELSGILLLGFISTIIIIIIIIFIILLGAWGSGSANQAKQFNQSLVIQQRKPTRNRFKAAVNNKKKYFLGGFFFVFFFHPLSVILEIIFVSGRLPHCFGPWQWLLGGSRALPSPTFHESILIKVIILLIYPSTFSRIC